MASLDELLEAKSAEEVKEIILGSIQEAAEEDGFPVTDWDEGGVLRTLIEGFSGAVADLEASLPLLAAGGFADGATGDWLTLVSEYVYRKIREEPSHTTGTVYLDCEAGKGPYVFAARALAFVGEGGNRYVNTSGGTLREPGITAVTQIGAGAGTVTPVSPDDTGISVKILIIVGGAPGTATYQLSTDGGLTYGDTTTTPAGGTTTADPRSGVVVTFAGVFVAGNSYTFDIHGRLALTVESEEVNDSTSGFDYNDATGTITEMQPPLPGVTCTNDVTTRSFTDVTHTGSGDGAVEVRAKNYADVTSGTYEIEILSDGDAGTATFRYRKDAGDWSGTKTTAAIYSDQTLDNYNVVIRFTNGDESPAFVDDDTYETTSPGTWVTAQGADEETDEALFARDDTRWPDLDAEPDSSVYETLATDASSKVTRVLVVESATINNRLNVYVAGRGGTLGADVVDEVQAYTDARKALTDDPIVSTPTEQAVTLAAGIVRVQTAFLDSAQANAQKNVANYIASVAIGGTVRIRQIIEAILRESGGEDDDVTGLTLNGSTSNLVLTSLQVATWTQLIATALTWTTYEP